MVKLKRNTSSTLPRISRQLRLLSLLGWSMVLSIATVTAQQISSATIEGGSNSNRLIVNFSESITVSDGGAGFRLVGGVARIDKLLSGSGSSTLTFSLTDYALPDDRFTLLHWPEMSDARGSSGKLNTENESVSVNSSGVTSYRGDGTLYYVSDSEGSDSGSGRGSRNAPFKTVAAAQNMATPGDYILLMRGDQFDAFEVTKSGNDGDGPIAFAAYGDPTDPNPIVEGIEDIRSASGYSAAVLINQKDYITVDNLHIISKRSGVAVLQTGSQIIVSNCLIEGALNEGTGGVDFANIQSQQNTYTNPQVLNNTIRKFRRSIYLSGFPYNDNYEVEGGVIENNVCEDHRSTDASDGIVLSRGDFGGLVTRKNDVSDYWDDGIDIYAGSNVIVEYNTFNTPAPTNSQDNSRRGIKAGGLSDTNDGDKIGGYGSSNVVVRYNVVRNISNNNCSVCDGISTNAGLSGEIYGNLIYNVDRNGIVLDAPENWVVYNNTIVNTRGLGINIYIKNAEIGDAANISIKNNIIQGERADIAYDVRGGAPQFEASNNILVNNETIGAYQSSGDLQATIAELFENNKANNYSLKAGSPAIDAGTASIPTYERDIQGYLITGTPDIGAFEYGNRTGGLDPSEPPTGAPPTLFLAGASMTKNDNGLQQGWGEELPALMKEELTIVNGADPGESTKSFVERITNQGDTFWGRLLNQVEAGDYVVLNFGHNDQSRTDEYQTTAGSEDNNYDGTYKAYLKQMAQDVLNLGATPIITSPAERAIFNNYNLTNSHNNYVPAARQAAQEVGALYLDMNAGSRDWMNQVGEADIDDYFPGYRRSSPGTSDRSSDITHTNSAGALKNAQVFVDLLQESSSPLKQYIKGVINPPPSPENGVNYAYYKDETENWSALPDFASLSPEKEGTLANFSLSPAEQADFYGFVYTTYLEVEQAGEYTFYLLSDDGSQLLIEGEEVVSYDGRHSATEEQSGKVVLSKGRHRLVVRYFEYRFSQSLQVSYQGPGVSKQTIPDEVLFLKDDEQPDTPTVSQQVWLEAECASSVGSAWQVKQSSQASEGAYVVYTGSKSLDQAPSGSNAALVYEVDLAQAGNYYLLARLQAPDAAANSVWLKIDEGAWIKWWEGITLGNSFEWNLAPGGAVSLSSGVHTLRVAYREGGTQLDKLLLSTESTLPEGTGSQASNCTSPPASENGVAYRYYQDQTENWSALPDFTSLSPEKEGTLENFSLAPAEQADHYGFVYTTYLEVDKAGEYTFYLLSDDGSQLLMEGQQVVSYDGRHSASEEQSGKIVLSAGRHKLEVRYFEYRYSQSLLVSYQGPGVSKQAIPDEVLFLDEAPTAPPVTTEVIVDNRDAGFSTVGDWSTGNYQKNNRYGADYRHDGNTSKGSKIATFTASVTPGNYEVYAWWTADTNRASNVPVQISYACGVASTTVNQRENGGSWQLLGTYYFEEEVSVTLSNAGTDGHVLADAVRFLSSGSDEPCQEPSTSTQVWLEAECADQVGEAWQVVADSEASGGSYLQVQPGNSSVSAAPTASAKQLTFTFSVSQAGEYTLYSRQQENGSNNDDSFWVRANTGSWVKNGLNTPAGSFAWGAARDADNNFSQVTFSLVAGSNTLTLGTREDNLQLDKLYVSLANTAPIGKGGTASNCSSPARQASWAKSGKANLESESDQLQVYPNPADTEMTVQLPSSGGHLLITDLTGRLVRQVIVSAQSERYVLDVQDIPAGMYLLRWHQADRQAQYKVIIE